MADIDRRCEDFDTKPGVHYHAHDLPRCKEQAVVGWGSPARWICERHLRQRLTEARQVAEKAAQLLDDLHRGSS